MTVRIEHGRDIFEINNGLGKLFPKLDSSEMEWVVYVADSNSIYRMKSDAERRLLALKLCDGFWVADKPTAKGQKLVDRKNKDVESAIVVYHKEINVNKRHKLSETIETLGGYYDELLGFMKKVDSSKLLSSLDVGDEGKKKDGDFKEQVKLFENVYKAVKESAFKTTYEQIKYFEEQLSFEFEIPDVAIEDTKEVESISTTTADNIDVSKI